MRVTLTLDDNVHGAIKQQAALEGRTMGDVLSDLLRGEFEKSGLLPVSRPESDGASQEQSI